MPIGIILLIFTILIIYFGAAQRVLDHLYLPDTAALIIVAGIIVGSFVDIPLSQDPVINVNLGGALIPVGLVIYIYSKVDSSKEIIRSIIAIFATGAVIYFVSVFFRNFGEGRDIIDPMYIFAITGGLFGYIFGRSRRGAFIAGTMGFLSYNMINVWRTVTGRINTNIYIGGAGAFDNIILSGFIGLLLAEIIGETRESIHKMNPEKQRDDNNE
ncbi:MAG: DUF1614 domain-containing protein [bacterium]